MNILSTKINQKLAQGFYEATHGIDIDKFFYREEFEVQLAWIKELHLSSYISIEEYQILKNGLLQIRSEIGEDRFLWCIEDEDIHLSIEKHLIHRCGSIGKKIHLGRSRNDLVATSLKLYTAQKCQQLMTSILNIANSLLNLSFNHIDLIVPAYTHSQAAQPIRISSLWLFHAINFQNDIEQLSLCYKKCLRWMPLGSAAISGTHLNLNLERLASALNFNSPPINSVHAVSDRDDSIDLCYCISKIGLHLSRFCEDIIRMSSTPLGIIQLPEEWASGSSIMPNKKNPDFFEIARSKSKKFILLSQETLQSVSCLSSGYSSDFHELKRTLIEQIEHFQRFLSYFPTVISSLKVNLKNSNIALQNGHILATDLANQLVQQGLPFREAYTKVADLIVNAEKSNTSLKTEGITFESSVELRNNRGGTSKAQILDSITQVKNFLENI